jgi:hypothetical protein
VIQLGEYRLEMERRGAVCRLCHGADVVLAESSWPVDARRGADDVNIQCCYSWLNTTRPNANVTACQRCCGPFGSARAHYLRGDHVTRPPTLLASGFSAGTKLHSLTRDV